MPPTTTATTGQKACDPEELPARGLFGIASLMGLPFDTFTFTHRSLERDTVRLGFRLEGGGERLDLEETFTLPPEMVTGRDEAACVTALRGLHLVAGVSYWKTCCPPRIVVSDGPLAPSEADYLDELYTHGLGEFFYRNSVAPLGKVRFERGGVAETVAVKATAGEGSLVLIGGGKDSCVSIEALRHGGEPVTLFSLGEAEWIRRAARASGYTLLSVKRRIDPQLFALNQRGALNGHVPISALIAHLSLLCALRLGKAATVASNERSASFGNFEFGGIEINHQWSKSLRFERLFAAWCARHIDGAPPYVSLLRPLSELRIARELTRHPRYFDDITSCNRNFTLAGKAAPERWCGACPKCVFVYTCCAPFIDDAARGALFGRSFLADPANLPMLRSLTAAEGHKPFECVGTPDEVLAALELCRQRGREGDTPAMRWFAEAYPQGAPELVGPALAPSPEHCLPPRYQAMLEAYLAAG